MYFLPPLTRTRGPVNGPSRPLAAAPPIQGGSDPNGVFSDLHVSKEDSVKPRRDQLESQLFEAEYLTDEDPVLVPADVAAILHPP